jgi:copper oxidase (laccase) domain-containing protein
VRGEQVFVATACTRCHPELFHSYRRNGSGGPLMAAVAARRT